MKWRILATLDLRGDEKCCKANEHFAHNREKLYNSCSASFHGKTGKLRSPGISVPRVYRRGKRCGYHPGRSTTEVRGW